MYICIYIMRVCIHVHNERVLELFGYIRIYIHALVVSLLLIASYMCVGSGGVEVGVEITVAR